MYKVYGRPDCEFCSLAVQLLNNLGLKYEYLDVVENKNYLDDLLDVLPDVKTLPQIFLGDYPIGGYSELKSDLFQSNLEAEIDGSVPFNISIFKMNEPLRGEDIFKFRLLDTSHIFKTSLSIANSMSWSDAIEPVMVDVIAGELIAEYDNVFGLENV